MTKYIPEEIKSKISMLDILSKYINYSGRNNRIPCPLHNGKNDNFAFNKNRYICFKCGEKGDVITFVMTYFGLDFKSALHKLNDDFNLNLIKTKKEFSRRDMLNAIQTMREREQEKKRFEEQRQTIENKYWSAFDEWKRYDDNKRIYRPKTINEELHPLFVEALQNIATARYNFEIADTEMREFEKCRQA